MIYKAKVSSLYDVLCNKMSGGTKTDSTGSNHIDDKREGTNTIDNIPGLTKFHDLELKYNLLPFLDGIDISNLEKAVGVNNMLFIDYGKWDCDDIMTFTKNELNQITKIKMSSRSLCNESKKIAQVIMAIIRKGDLQSIDLSNNVYCEIIMLHLTILIISLESDSIEKDNLLHLTNFNISYNKIDPIDGVCGVGDISNTYQIRQFPKLFSKLWLY